MVVSVVQRYAGGMRLHSSQGGRIEAGYHLIDSLTIPYILKSQARRAALNVSEEAIVCVCISPCCENNRLAVESSVDSLMTPEWMYTQWAGHPLFGKVKLNRDDLVGYL